MDVSHCGKWMFLWFYQQMLHISRGTNLKYEFSPFDFEESPPKILFILFIIFKQGWQNLNSMFQIATQLHYFFRFINEFLLDFSPLLHSFLLFLTSTHSSLFSFALMPFHQPYLYLPNQNNDAHYSYLSLFPLSSFQNGFRGTHGSLIYVYVYMATLDLY